VETGTSAEKIKRKALKEKYSNWAVSALMNELGLDEREAIGSH
jgi:hypothetical protein